MRFGSAASAAVLFLAACSAGGDSAHSSSEAHGETAGHALALGPDDAHAAPAHAESAHAAPAHAPQAHDQHWSYSNQRAWVGLSGTCGGGREQSPINFSSAMPMAETADLTLHYLPAAGRYVNNGHTLQFTPAAHARLSIGADEYTLAQFHFHAPAEHTVDRRAYPVELHFVHRNQAGQLAVVGVFIEEGVENAALAALLARSPDGEGDAHATELEVNLMALLPADRMYFAYAGSLTTPPCSEGVRWNVLRTPISASPEQIAALREALGASSRHVQPILERTVLLGS